MPITQIDDEISIETALAFTRNILKDVSSNPQQESLWILQELLQCDSVFLRLNPQRFLNLAQKQGLHDILGRRLTCEPLAYIFKRQNFYGLDFTVNSSVLIPRPETERLLEVAFNQIERTFLTYSQAQLNSQGRAFKILDLGTGSGCLAVHLKKKFPQASVVAWDISEQALQVARHNASELLGPHHGIVFELKNGLDPLNWQLEPFDVILTNPPYIGDGEKLPISVYAFEPHTALFSGSDPLRYYREMAVFLADGLVSGGIFLCECGSSQADAIKEILTHWRLSEIEVYLDYGGIARVIKALNS